MIRKLTTITLVAASLSLVACDDDDFHYESTSRLVPGELLDPEGQPIGLRLAEVSPEFIFYYDNNGHLRGIDDYDRNYYKANSYNNRLIMAGGRGRYSVEEEYAFTYQRDLVSEADVRVKEVNDLEVSTTDYHYDFFYNAYGELYRYKCTTTVNALEAGVPVMLSFHKTTDIEYYKDGALRGIEHLETQDLSPNEEWHYYDFDSRDAEYNLYRQYTPTILCTLFGDYQKQSGLFGLHAWALLGYFGSAPLYLPWEVEHEWEVRDALGKDVGHEFSHMRYKFFDDEVISVADGCEYRYDEW